jgi:hypothetical protein
MLKRFLGTQNIVFALRINSVHKRSFSKEEEPPNRDALSKNYINDLKKNLTDFQNEFGFDESLKEIRLENIKAEKRISRSYQVLVLLVVSTGILAFHHLFCKLLEALS